jgi:hypothetical protein
VTTQAALLFEEISGDAWPGLAAARQTTGRRLENLKAADERRWMQITPSGLSAGEMTPFTQRVPGPPRRTLLSAFVCFHLWLNCVLRWGENLRDGGFRD